MAALTRRMAIAHSFLAVWVIVAASPLGAVEPWADPAMGVTEGLIVWLDASRQPQAWLANERRQLENGARLDAWYDASGEARHFLQTLQDNQPRYESVGEVSVVKFDGADDFLSRLSKEKELGDFTLLVRAAPLSNAGYFRAFFAVQRLGFNDYTSGMTIDMGGLGSARFDALCAEGFGFQGSQSLLDDAAPFGGSHVFSVVSNAAQAKRPGRVDLFVDGKPQRSRGRTSDALRMDGMTVGARCYSNSAEPPFVSGFLDGEIAEILLYRRALADDERAAIEKYLTEKYASLGDRSDQSGKRLTTVADPPAVQMFVPGFVVRELPVALPNINNVRYRPDGKLVALAYSGDVYLLSDTDGDGLEDRGDAFWKSNGRIRAPIGMDLTPAGYSLGFGVFAPSKGKCSLILDRDGDDIADEEVIVADGWKEGPHGVDAVGAAFDRRDGSLYFALGTEDYTNAYVVDERGQGHYSLASERGAVLKVAPDFKSREIFSTGVRFPVGMAFNAAGDLFAADQEGATWLANGNPFDELLHVERGRHYGFPPRHPRHLPGVIDEPSVYDYSPQHQSTCGLQFNEPVGGAAENGSTFGPSWWQGDALVCGYSRGKLFRTQLVNTAAGYVARNQIVASFNMLTADACVGPRGELVVAVHSGGPDWGTGPTGAGKLYKIVYRDEAVAQPVVAWAASPNEVHISFDRPIGEQQLKLLTAAGNVGIEFGEHVRAGDRFESIRPGYEVVSRQLSAPRHELAVHAVQVSPDLRTLIVTTAEHQQTAHYAVALPRAAMADGAATGLAQHDSIDLDYSLGGVEAKFVADTGEIDWSGWLPHFDLQVSQKFTEQSAEHAMLWKLLNEKRGKLELRGSLNLADTLRPALQPGARIDYRWSEERVTLHLTSSQPFSGAGKTVAVPIAEATRFELHVALTIDPRIETEFSVAWSTNEDDRVRALPLSRIRLPWAPEPGEPSEISPASRERPELAGGDWGRGRRLFFGELAGCAKCHTHFGAGGKIGPDLSNLLQRDYASVHRDVTQPSYAINPDFLTYAAELTDGRVLTGSVRTESGKLHIGSEKGDVSIVDAADVESLHTMPISTMPKGLDEKLGEQGMKDLLTFLLTAPSMPDYGPLPPPEARTKAEVAAVLDGAAKEAKDKATMRIVLVAGPKDHGPGEHDYPAWQETWRKLLAADDSLAVSTAWEWPSQGDFDDADCLVFYQHGDWNNERAKQIDDYLKRGGGLVYLHFAVDGGADASGFAERIGLAWQGGASRFRHGELMLDFTAGQSHPIARNFDAVGFHDESYWNLIGDPKTINLLADGEEEGQRQPLFWTCEHGDGRVFVSILGHFSWTFDDPLFRILLLRGIAWSAREDVDRLNDLVLPGARVR